MEKVAATPRIAIRLVLAAGLLGCSHEYQLADETSQPPTTQPSAVQPSLPLPSDPPLDAAEPPPQQQSPAPIRSATPEPAPTEPAQFQPAQFDFSSLPPESPAADQFPNWIAQHRRSLKWQRHDTPPQLTAAVLSESLELGRQYLVHNQTPQGNFNYQYDFVTRQLDHDDNQVRQAGATWGLALILRHRPDPETRAALDRAMQFFFRHTKLGPEPGTLLIEYAGNPDSSTGTMALVSLAIIETLRADTEGRIRLDDIYRTELNAQLDGYLAMLKYLRMPNGHFAQSFSLRFGRKLPLSSPYFDGESLLCLIQAAKYLHRNNLIPLIEESAMAMARHYTLEAWQDDPDSAQTKGFFQWSCMAFWEYQDAGWRDSPVFADCVVSLAHWMIHTHRTLSRTRNTAYAYEGIIPAWQLAVAQGDHAAAEDLAYTIDTGLTKLTSWQVGGPLQTSNPFLLAHPTTDPLAIGGIMNHSEEAPLRIDVTQHQTHAVIMALENVYSVDQLRR
ncbi:MAG TPA: hypothetical protein VE890_08445 [Thermoguttaceae bacterium]|nr:hypothetical protein [Thermoguttaceae bacterium]